MSGLLIVIVVVAFIWLFTLWLIRKGRAEYRVQASELREIASIPVAEAESLAVELLTNRRLFKCVEAPNNETFDPNELAEGLKRLFSRYRLIETTAGPKARIDRGMINVSTLRRNYIRIGRGMEGTDVEYEICTLPKEEEVYEIYPRELPDPVFGKYRSVYHWILAASKEGGNSSSTPP